MTSESNSGALARSNRGHSAKAKSSSLHSNQETKPGDCIGSSRSSENLEPILSELRLRREEVDRLRNKLENVKVCTCFYNLVIWLKQDHCVGFFDLP